MVLGFLAVVSMPVFAVARQSAFPQVPEIVKNSSSQTEDNVLRAYTNRDQGPIRFKTLAIVNDTALVSGSNNTSETFIDAGQSGTGQISVYVVRKGDTLSSVAKMFGVSANTIVWANDLKSNTLKDGQELVILPISGVRHIVKSGDTLASIAKKYKTDLAEILSYNDLSANAKLKVGDEVIVPDGEIVVSVSSGSSSAGSSVGASYPTYSGYYMRPLVGGRKTQGIHGHNGVDIGRLPVGSPVMASAEGTVIIAKTSGWNGGYGLYIVVSHPNGTQTLYSHLSKVSVSTGQRVEQGQTIGALGNTGKSTGPHLHFEIRGARNPF